MANFARYGLADPTPLYRLRRLVLAIGFVGGSAAMQAATAQEVTLRGSTTVLNTIVAPHQAEIEQRSGQTLKLVGNGSQRGIADLVIGRAQIAMISAPLTEDAKRLDQATAVAIAAEKKTELPRRGKPLLLEKKVNFRWPLLDVN